VNVLPYDAISRYLRWVTSGASTTRTCSSFGSAPRGRRRTRPGTSLSRPEIGNTYAFPGEQLTPPVERDEDLWRRHREQVEAVFAEVGVRVDFAGIAGDPADELIEAADQRQADLIVVGTREPGLVERLLGGSVSQAVARRAHCDVLIVHPGDAG